MKAFWQSYHEQCVNCLRKLVGAELGRDEGSGNEQLQKRRLNYLYLRNLMSEDYHGLIGQAAQGIN